MLFDIYIDEVFTCIEYVYELRNAIYCSESSLTICFRIKFEYLLICNAKELSSTTIISAPTRYLLIHFKVEPFIFG